MQCQARHVKQCALAPILRDLRAMRQPDHAAEHASEFAATMQSFYDNGDHFGDYDGPLTSVATNSVCF